MTAPHPPRLTRSLIKVLDEKPSANVAIPARRFLTRAGYMANEKTNAFRRLEHAKAPPLELRHSR